MGLNQIMEKIIENRKKKNKEKLSTIDIVKISCEIVSVFLIGALSVYIGYQANKISQAQLELAQAQSYAQFIINEECNYDDNGRANNHTVKIFCQNGYFTNYNSDIFTILYLSCDDGYTYKIPLVGYWFVHAKTGNMQGLIETIGATDNHKKYFELLDVLKTTHKKIIDINIKHFLSISYYDCTQTVQERFYQVKPISGTTIVEEELFIKEKEDFDKMFKENNYIDLDRYTIKDIQSINDMMCIEQ